MARRDNGDGCIYKVSDSKYVARIMIGYAENGRPKIKTFSSKTEAGAKKKLREFRKAMAAGESVSDCIVNDFANKWLTTRKNTMKPLSFSRVVSTYNTHIGKHIGNTLMRNVTGDDIQKIMSLMESKSYSGAKKVYDFLNGMFEYALGFPPALRVVDYNPCRFIQKPKQTSYNTTSSNGLKFFSDEEIRAIREEITREEESTGARVYKYGEFFNFLLNTGLRLGEALALTKEDIDFEAKTARINKNLIQIQDSSGYSVVVQNDLKTFSSSRVIPLNDEAIRSIKWLFDAFPNTEYIALNKNGFRITPQNCEKTFSTILDRAGILANGRKCHALRHTFATQMFKNGIDIKIISNVLGHSSVKITYDIYVSIIQEQQAQAVCLTNIGG